MAAVRTISPPWVSVTERCWQDETMKRRQEAGSWDHPTRLSMHGRNTIKRRPTQTQPRHVAPLHRCLRLYLDTVRPKFLSATAGLHASLQRSKVTRPVTRQLVKVKEKRLKKNDRSLLTSARLCVWTDEIRWPSFFSEETVSYREVLMGVCGCVCVWGCVCVCVCVCVSAGQDPTGAAAAARLGNPRGVQRCTVQLVITVIESYVIAARWWFSYIITPDVLFFLSTRLTSPPTCVVTGRRLPVCTGRRPRILFFFSLIITSHAVGGLARQQTGRAAPAAAANKSVLASEEFSFYSQT